ncbi:hypothetical protein EV363DRAFT_1214630 [Boletus edulis]|nr:hypothetical protein EV363DRAFT_1214630 [Boletus edulis]
MSWNAATSGCEFKVMPIDALECTSVTNISSLWFRRQRRHGFPLARHSLKAQARCSSCNISMSPPPTRSLSHGRIQPHHYAVDRFEMFTYDPIDFDCEL